MGHWRPRRTYRAPPAGTVGKLLAEHGLQFEWMKEKNVPAVSEARHSP